MSDRPFPAYSFLEEVAAEARAESRRAGRFTKHYPIPDHWWPATPRPKRKPKRAEPKKAPQLRIRR